MNPNAPSPSAGEGQQPIPMNNTQDTVTVEVEDQIAEHRQCPGCGHTLAFEVFAPSWYHLPKGSPAEKLTPIIVEANTPVRCPACNWQGQWAATAQQEFIVLCRADSGEDFRKASVWALSAEEAAYLGHGETAGVLGVEEGSVVCFGVFRVRPYGELSLWAADGSGVPMLDPRKRSAAKGGKE